jgi:glutaredoxin 3
MVIQRSLQSDSLAKYHQMKHRVIIYTKDNCPYCVQAKSLLSLKDQSYTEMKIGSDLSREEFMEIFPNVKTVPFIIINEERIGGYDRLVEYYDRPEQQFLAE